MISLSKHFISFVTRRYWWRKHRNISINRAFLLCRSRRFRIFNLQRTLRLTASKAFGTKVALYRVLSLFRPSVIVSKSSFRRLLRNKLWEVRKWKKYNNKPRRRRALSRFNPFRLRNIIYFYRMQNLLRYTRKTVGCDALSQFIFSCYSQRLRSYLSKFKSPTMAGKFVRKRRIRSYKLQQCSGRWRGYQLFITSNRNNLFLTFCRFGRVIKVFNTGALHYCRVTRDKRAFSAFLDLLNVFRSYIRGRKKSIRSIRIFINLKQYFSKLTLSFKHIKSLQYTLRGALHKTCLFWAYRVQILRSHGLNVGRGSKLRRK